MNALKRLIWLVCSLAVGATATFGAPQRTQNFNVDPGWAGVGNLTLGNNYGYSAATSFAGGSAGEAGGTFARTGTENYYADTNLTETLTFHHTLGASGKF